MNSQWCVLHSKYTIHLLIIRVIGSFYNKQEIKYLKRSRQKVCWLL